VSKTTTTAPADVAGAGASVDEVQEALATVARAFVQPRVHERLMRAAGVRLDRGGAALLYKLRLHGDALRVTALADLLGIDAPTVTRKVQQLERDGLVSRRPDADDGRAWRMEERGGSQSIHFLGA
jgi:DNA-binding MarR family transcriptional regulator